MSGPPHGFCGVVLRNTILAAFWSMPSSAAGGTPTTKRGQVLRNVNTAALDIQSDL